MLGQPGLACLLSERTLAVAAAGRDDAANRSQKAAGTTLINTATIIAALASRVATMPGARFSGFFR